MTIFSPSPRHHTPRGLSTPPSNHKSPSATGGPSSSPFRPSSRSTPTTLKAVSRKLPKHSQSRDHLRPPNDLGSPSRPIHQRTQETPKRSPLAADAMNSKSATSISRVAAARKSQVAAQAAQTQDNSSPPMSKPKLKPPLAGTGSRVKTLNQPLQLRTPTRRASQTILGTVALDLVLDLNTPAQPTTLLRKRASRLPRATPSAAHARLTSNESSSEASTKKSLPTQRKASRPRLECEPARSEVLSSLAEGTPATPSHSIDHSNPSTDQDKTPKRPAKQIPRPKKLQANYLADPKRASKPPGQSRQTVKEINIVVSPMVEETANRPLTRARSKHLLSASGSTDASSLPESSAPRVRRKPSRVLQLAQSFEEPGASADEAVARSSSLQFPSPRRRPQDSGPGDRLGTTPVKRTSAPLSNGSGTTRISPSTSGLGNSPNLSALAASLSKQHVHRQRLSRARSSINDMLRYSTMSTLGTLRWEDGAGDVLLTDADETEAMVADISMAETTPLKPAVQSAAIALASARANFLSAMQEDGQDTGGAKQGAGCADDGARRPPASHESPLVDMRTRRQLGVGERSPLARPRQSGTSAASPSTLGQLVAQESQLASLSASLEESRERERELERQLGRLSAASPGDEGAEERESLLVEEIERLEEELARTVETNVELENALDRARFENEQLVSRQESLHGDLDALRRQIGEAEKKHGPLNTPGRSAGRETDSDAVKRKLLEKSVGRSWMSMKEWKTQTCSELEIIRSQLAMLNVLKLSLSVQENLVL